MTGDHFEGTKEIPCMRAVVVP